jgi:hypothetical protein
MSGFLQSRRIKRPNDASAIYQNVYVYLGGSSFMVQSERELAIRLRRGASKAYAILGQRSRSFSITSPSSSSQPPFCCRLGALGARLWSCFAHRRRRYPGGWGSVLKQGTAALPIAARRRAVISRPPIVRNSRVNEARPKGDRGAPFSWIPSLQLSERRRKIVL